MKKYKLRLCESAGIELTEEQFNNLQDCAFTVDGTNITKGKEIPVKGKTYPFLICTPIDNFEVIDDNDNNSSI